MQNQLTFMKPTLSKYLNIKMLVSDSNLAPPDVSYGGEGKILL